MFLSANNFFWRVRLRGRTLERLQTWRSPVSPRRHCSACSTSGTTAAGDGALFVVRPSAHYDWAFAGNRASPRFVLRRFGIEIDHMTRDSPPGTTPLAEVPNPSAAAARRR